MKYLLVALSLLAVSCRMITGKRVEGNSIMKTETRDVRDFKKIEIAGDFDVELQPGDEFKVTIQGDENLLQYVKTRKKNGAIQISEEDGFNLHSSKGISLVIQMPELEGVSIAGSGSVKSASKIETSSSFKVDIAGGGDAVLDLKSPKVIVSIGGSGSATLKGVTRNLDISIGGSGNCNAEELKSENCDISIGGSGSAKVFASISLDASIGGSGDIFYAGSPQNVKKSIGGSGSIEEIK